MQETALYIEIMVTPGDKIEKSIDTLELCLANCVYLGFTHIVLNFELIKKYDIMFLTPLYDLLNELKTNTGAQFIVTHPPLLFMNEFEELYTEKTIPLIHNREDILTDTQDIVHTFLEDDDTIIPTLKQEAAAKILNEMEERNKKEEAQPQKSTLPLLVPEIIDSNPSFSYFDQDKDIEVCTISGEYECHTCSIKEYFMKGFPFDTCNSKDCAGKETTWKLIKKVF